MELGRRLLTAWGYARESELCWIKLNLMQNLVRTGRTGHFLNHSKEHCLIGVKGDPPLGAPGVRRDCDVLVSELRGPRGSRRRFTASRRGSGRALDAWSCSLDSTTSASPGGSPSATSSTAFASWTPNCAAGCGRGTRASSSRRREEGPPRSRRTGARRRETRRTTTRENPRTKRPSSASETQRDPPM